MVLPSPAKATQKAIKPYVITDVSFEFNEAFAVVGLANAKILWYR
jgi:hypothetical protein